MNLINLPLVYSACKTQFNLYPKLFFKISCRVATMVALICTANGIAQSPSLSWANAFGGSLAENSTDVKYDNSGNVYTIGSYQGTVDFDPSPATFTITSQGLTDVFITKFDSNGNFIWVKSMGGTGDDIGNALNIDPSGNVLAIGSFDSGAADFDPGTPTLFLNALGSIDIFILKLDANGNFVWAKRIGSANDENGYSIATDASGNVYSTGYFKSNVDFNPGPSTNTLTAAGGGATEEVFISKLDANGNYVYAKQIGGVGVDIGYSIQLDASGNVFIGGCFSVACDFDPGVGTSTINSYGLKDGFIASIDALGNFISAKRIGGTGDDEVFSYVVNSAGNNYFTGTFTGTADFDPSATNYTVTANGIRDIFICKFNTSGNFTWAKTVGSTGNDYSYKISVDNSGNVYTCGTFSNTADFDPGAGTYSLTSAGAQDAFILKLNSLGVFVWATQIGNTGSDFARSLIINSSNEIYTTGSFQSTADFDPTVTTYTLASNGSSDAFIQKLNQQCVAPVTPTDNTPPANLSICASSTTSLSATGTGTLNWYPTATSTTSIGSGTSYVTPVLSAGTYTYYVEAATCTVSISRLAITVTVNPTPTITVNSGSICIGQSFTISPGGASSYTIEGGNSVVSPTVTTSYTVTGTSGAGCVSAAAATANVTVNNLPTVVANVMPSATVCAGTSILLFGGGASTYTWSGGVTNNSSFTPTVSSTYTVSGTDANGCVNTAIKAITVNPLPTVTANASPSSTLCAGSNLTLSGGGASTYSWSGGVTDAVAFTPTVSATYTLTGTDANGCYNTTTQVITVNALPNVTLSVSSNTLCINDAPVALTGSPSGGIYSGTGVVGSNFDPSVSGAGTFTLSYNYTDINSCSNVATAIMNVGACTATSQITNLNSQVSVFPNPFLNELNVNCTSALKVAVYNVLGEKMHEFDLVKGIQTIDLSSLSPGIYYLQIENKQIKIIKQ